MFSRILIANRGEIACRIIATCQRMGIETVAVYSDADRMALHVDMADHAVHIGPAEAAQSYLQGDRIIAAALATRAQAIHPGYGFLSENPEFAEAVGVAGLVFIGPTPAAIRAMGLKDAAKALMVSAGVPVVPGYHGSDQDPDLLAAEADKIGYPVLIKARAGGGGKGMRLVSQPSEFKTSFESACREGNASFGDPHCLIEKYVNHPRHIEVQVFGDTQGNVIHLNERDCSLQRRHQKVIEESPAPDMPPVLRQAMGQAAVEAAKAIGYCGAGTVEFIVDGSGPLHEGGFWFMEMNTRLQVEHPVTEAVTGVDLVEWQLRVAAGAPLPLTQDEVPLRGHAVEARIYAEDVAKGFLPAAGPLKAMDEPAASRFEQGTLRIDTGVRAGDEISPHYDPMIGKLIAHGPDRTAALAQLRAGLSVMGYAGVTTNRDFLIHLLGLADVQSGAVQTGLIAQNPQLQDNAKPEPAHWAVAAAAIARRQIGRDPFDRLHGFALWGGMVQSIPVTWRDETSHMDLRFDAADMWFDEIMVSPVAGGFQVTEFGRTRRIRAYRFGRDVTLVDGARTLDFSQPDPLAVAADGVGQMDHVLAPMTGVIRHLAVVPGQHVAQGDTLMILEAMKMEHRLVAPRNAVVTSVLAVEDQQVADASLLVTFEAEIEAADV
ncbi:biotin carboxylase N-terminal domain-containing protein [Algirhabdus cladophorae]|uniref:ATP-binding protein n=1 Tax=Algirhabdus cladophorae TaxID=3377108 RepID=UPI003B84A260